MSATNSTLNYQLPQFIATDKPAWLVDFNGAMSTIDTAIKEAKTAGDNAQQTANTNTTNIATLDGTVTSQGTAIGALTTSVAGNTGSINTINSLIGNGEPTTTDKTIIGAINEINSKVGDVEADNVSFDNANTGLSATDVQAAIVEVKGLIPSGPGSVDADDVSYSNTSSGLSATNVQDAIDELAQGGTSVPDFNLVNYVAGTVTSSFTVYNTTDVHVLTNADSSIGKIYGCIEVRSSIVVPATTWTKVASLSASNLPTIADEYNIIIGTAFGISGNYTNPILARMVFKANGTVDFEVYGYTAQVTFDQVIFSLTPCLLFLKDLGD